MNVQLSQAVSDITGVTGLKIIEAILAGERSPEKLAALREPGCKKSAEEIGQALPQIKAVRLHPVRRPLLAMLFETFFAAYRLLHTPSGWRIVAANYWRSVAANPWCAFSRELTFQRLAAQRFIHQPGGLARPVT